MTYVLDHHATNEELKADDKISIHQLLHEEENNPLLRPYAEGTIRHVHLPANNMRWVEVSVSQIDLPHHRVKILKLKIGSHSEILL